MLNNRLVGHPGSQVVRMEVKEAMGPFGVCAACVGPVRKSCRGMRGGKAKSNQRERKGEREKERKREEQKKVKGKGDGKEK